MGILPNTAIPALEDVAAIVWTRATEGPFEDGTNITFTADTRPTASQVTGMIASAAQIVGAKVGSRVPDSLIELAKSVTATRAAMNVVLSASELDWKGSAALYDRLEKMYDADLLDLVEASQQSVDHTDESFGATEGPRVPSYWAPPARLLEW